MTNRRKTAPRPFTTSQISMAPLVNVSFSLDQISMTNLGECLPDAANWRNINKLALVDLDMLTLSVFSTLDTPSLYNFLLVSLSTLRVQSLVF
jgi:hypothetical protein